MRTIKTILTLFMICGVLLAQSDDYRGAVTPTYYGFSGLAFIPTTQILQKNDWAISYSTEPGSGDDLTLKPFAVSVRLTPGWNGLEIGFSNTYILASNREFGGVLQGRDLDEKNTILPYWPSLKYQFMPMNGSNFNMAMAVGIAAPYGVYYVLDKFFDLRLFDLTLHGGLGTKLTTYHAFAGFTLSFGERIAPFLRSFPTQLCAEGAWGGSLNQLDEKEEAFIAVSIRHAWTQSLFISTYFRIDQQPSIRLGKVVEQKPTNRMGLGLSLVL